MYCFDCLYFVQLQYYLTSYYIVHYLDRSALRNTHWTYSQAMPDFCLQNYFTISGAYTELFDQKDLENCHRGFCKYFSDLVKQDLVYGWNY